MGSDCAWDNYDETCDDPDNEDKYQWEGQLGSRNGADSGLYKFRALVPKDLNGNDEESSSFQLLDEGGFAKQNYDDIMVRMCEKVKMKPMCDHPSYCKTDPKSLYVGQDH